MPRWLLGYLKKRREAKFLDAFPDAVDIIVRGVKAGLPLLDCMKMITVEAPEPLKSRIPRHRRDAGHRHAAGRSLRASSTSACRCRKPTSSRIVISIQQKAGGNLSEALGNLSRVLRDRKKMKAKIQAMSQEAKASAGIIGALPIAVMIARLHHAARTYILLLFTEPLGNMHAGRLRGLDDRWACW